ncbi:MAG: hypothetical protein AAB325_12905 [Pseudomonadota bacterium]
MLKWLDKLGSKPDHPMHNIAAAKSLLADLPEDPGKALEEVTSWLNTLTVTEGFRLADRVGIVKLLDETGQPFESQLVHLYLKSDEFKEYARMRAWQVALEFWERLTDAYRLCLTQFGRDPKAARGLADGLPLLIVRCLRALANVTRVLRLRYLPVGDGIWQALFEVYRLSEAAGCDNQRFAAYAGDTLTTPRQELLCALMLDAATPESIRPRQVELTARAAARFADSFLFRPTPETPCNWYIDLAKPGRPLQVSARVSVQTTMRFFGAGIAIARIDEILQRMMANPDEKIKLLGEDYSSEDKLLVLKRLMLYWSEHPPRRRAERSQTTAEIEVTHEFKHVARVVPRVELSGMAEIAQGTMDVKLKESFRLQLAEDQQQVPTERWLEQDTSTWGVGVEIPRGSESWVRVGILCGLKDDAQQWWAGVVRRLYRDNKNRAHAGIEILAKKPVAVWLRGVGKDAAVTENWAASSDYSYLNVILLNDSAMAAQRNELLLARGVFQAGNIYEVMAGDTTRYLKFEELLGEGEDFNHVRFTWDKGKPQVVK